jgi:hypothetical protein
MQRNIIKSSSLVSLSLPDAELSSEIILYLERQKVVRKINQTKRSIATSEAKEEVEKLEPALADLRVDLNYILVT